MWVTVACDGTDRPSNSSALSRAVTTLLTKPEETEHASDDRR